MTDFINHLVEFFVLFGRPAVPTALGSAQPGEEPTAAPTNLGNIQGEEEPATMPINFGNTRGEEKPTNAPPAASERQVSSALAAYEVD